MQNTSIPIHFDVQGHRGARGLYPENTITGFVEAVRLGVNTLEMDVVVSRDSQIVVSHEAWMNEAFCTDPAGAKVKKGSKRLHNLFEMSYTEIAQYDCGKRGNARFPEQKAVPEYKPVLAEVIDKVEAYSQANMLGKVVYNIEMKSSPKDDGIFNPDPLIFVGLLYEELKKRELLQRCIVQSFDVRPLQALKNLDASVKIALLVENSRSPWANIQELGFLPDTYSPYFRLLNRKQIEELHQKRIKVIPWTVNGIDDIQRMIGIGVDGIISDYPNRVLDFIKRIL